MREYQSMIRSGKASIWIGNFTSEDALVSYVDDGQFGHDFDFCVNPRGRREMVAEKSGISLMKLAEGFSYWENFYQAFLTQSRERSIEIASCMLVLYAFEYVPSERVNRSAPLQFIGAFDFGVPHPN